MAESHDPEIVAVIRRITDRFVRTGKGTPVHEVRSKLGANRRALDEMMKQGFIAQVGDNYLPRLRAEEFENAATRNYIRNCTAMVLKALKLLYENGGAKDYSGAEVLTTSRQRIDHTAEAEMVRTGLHFATDFRGYFSGWSHIQDGELSSIIVRDDILDFESFDGAWEQELKWRAARENGSVQPRNQPAAQEPPTSRKGFVVGRYGKWETIRKLGQGGQGEVYLARDTEKFNAEQILLRITKAVVKSATATTEDLEPKTRNAQMLGAALMGAGSIPEELDAAARELAEAITEYGESESATHCGALKILHPPENPDEYETRLGRMKHEVDALTKVNHPNVAKILDANLDEHWFVMEYFPHGPLHTNRSTFCADITHTLVALRPLVEGVAELHRRNLVHRDIKPENIFVSPSRGLVLGDFGLVYFADEQRTRLSDTYENVGSRDWMPGWAMGMRIDDINPTFDVFSLGKLIWWMVSGREKLRLWYIHQPEFELEELFPGDPDIRWARIILDKCVVEDERDCLPDAGALLKEIDRVLSALRRRGQVISDNVPRVCRVCGLGHYTKVRHNHDVSLGYLGWATEGKDPTFKMFRCDRCGHAELFYLPGGESPPPTK